MSHRHSRKRFERRRKRVRCSCDRFIGLGYKAIDDDGASAFVLQLAFANLQDYFEK